MTSRFGKRNRSSSKLENSYSGDQTTPSRSTATLKKTKDFEKALEERDKTIARQAERIGELEKELESRRRFIDDLTAERNDLRRKNATLVSKLAEISRKQSVSSFTTFPSPPRLPRR